MLVAGAGEAWASARAGRAVSTLVDLAVFAGCVTVRALALSSAGTPARRSAAAPAATPALRTRDAGAAIGAAGVADVAPLVERAVFVVLAARCALVALLVADSAGVADRAVL